MEEYDRSNLNFLLSLNTDEEWKDFGSTIDEDDLKYAAALLEVYRLELIDEAVVTVSDDVVELINNIRRVNE